MQRIIAAIAASAVLGGVAITGLGCAKTQRDEPAEPRAARTTAAPVVLTVTSSAFSEGASIPVRFTCEGDDVSPPIAWSEPPPGTRSIAVVIEDPDAPDPDAPNRRTFTHWILYGVAPSTRELAPGMTIPPATMRSGVNDFEKIGYSGPCPPSGVHRYVVSVYALDSDLADLRMPKANELDRAIDGHVLGAGRLVGTYQRRRA